MWDFGHTYRVKGLRLKAHKFEILELRVGCSVGAMRLVRVRVHCCLGP